MRYVIVGGGIATIAAVEMIRTYDRKGNISVISGEKICGYSRPLISYLLAGKVEEKDLFFRGGGFYPANKVELLPGKRAVDIDVKKKAVLLENKRRIGYDKLLIATGGVPLEPKIKGRKLTGVFTFTRYDDAGKIKAFIGKTGVKAAVIVGGGLIGMKAAEALMELGIKVTIVELADRIMPRAFDRRTSRIIERGLRKAGCRVITGSTVTAIEGADARVGEVILADGKRVPARLVIIAAGVAPAVAWLKGTGIKIKQGVLVDRRMRTNIADIFAAGDAAEAYDRLYGANRLNAIWPNAYKQGAVAGANMVGHRMEYDGGFPMNSVEVGGIPVISVGLSSGEGKGCEILEYYQREEGVYKKLVLKDGKVVGAIFIGDISRTGIYTGLIREGINVSGLKDVLLTEDFGFLSLPREYRKHLVSGWGMTL